MELIKLSRAQHEKAAIICYPHAGGGVASYKNFLCFFPDDIGLYVFNYHTTSQRYDSREDLQSAAARSVQYLGNFTTPVALLGHSMGALMAYESTRHIDGMDAHLFLSGHSAPHVKIKGQNRYEMSEEALIDHVKKMGGTPEALLGSKEFLDMFLPMIRHDFYLCDTYTFCKEKRKKLPYPITALAGTMDQRMSVDKVNEWSCYTSKAFDLHQFKGGHFFIFNHIEAIANIIMKELRCEIF